MTFTPVIMNEVISAGDVDVSPYQARGYAISAHDDDAGTVLQLEQNPIYSVHFLSDPDLDPLREAHSAETWRCDSRTEQLHANAYAEALVKGLIKDLKDYVVSRTPYWYTML